ncbi:MAG: GWxTD domain-containing protein [Ignavibacteriae bacterium]|nr:GWxTD domain-containing protein [Ignavibacteria bacterium]MBI3365234.1 GWxTD domain-containing protein [Ignavibacteriota bacterium]
MKLHVLVPFFTLIAATFSAGVAQRPFESSRHEERPDFRQTPIFIEARNFTSSAPGKSMLTILYRVPERFFVAVRNPSAAPSQPLVIRPEVSVEILDKRGSAVARDLRRDDIGLENSPAESTETRSIQGEFSFDVQPAEYTLVVEVNDRESNRRFTDNRRTVTVKDFSQLPIALSDVLFLKAHAANAARIPVNFGGDIPLGENTECAVEVINRPTQDSLSLVYSMYREELNRRVLLQSQHAPLLPASPECFTVSMENDHLLTEMYRPPSGGVYSFFFAVRIDTLPEGEYVLELIAARGRDTIKKTQMFRVRWFDMPFTLRNLERAINALTYIAGKEEFDKMKHAPGDEQKRLFDAFWKKRDQTPATAYNEVMAEYYRRADYATSHFSTLQTTDGIETDRGKAYMLYGPPTTVTREMKPSIPPREVWEYASLKKRLIFVDENRHGDYVLLTTEER